MYNNVDDYIYLHESNNMERATEVLISIFYAQASRNLPRIAQQMCKPVGRSALGPVRKHVLASFHI